MAKITIFHTPTFQQFAIPMATCFIESSRGQCCRQPVVHPPYGNISAPGYRRDLAHPFGTSHLVISNTISPKRDLRMTELR